MGLGGYLMWTPLARELVKANQSIKVLPVEKFGDKIRVIKSEIFHNNPNFCDESFSGNVISIVLNDPMTNYCTFDSPQYCVQRHDKHVIQQICDVYGFKNVDLKCELFLTDKEEQFPGRIKLEKYVTIDPHTKNEYTVNKEYPFEKWQRIVNEISKDCIVVQVGRKTDYVLNNVVNMTGRSTFREAAAMIKNSKLFVGSEGGLMHAANAVGAQSVIVITGFLHPNMTCYSNNVNIWIGKSHGPCGMKVRCNKCAQECQQHDESEVITAIRSLLEK